MTTKRMYQLSSVIAAGFVLLSGFSFAITEKDWVKWISGASAIGHGGFFCFYQAQLSKLKKQDSNGDGLY